MNSAMASNMTIDTDLFFQTVSSGLVDELKKILIDIGPEEKQDR